MRGFAGRLIAAVVAFCLIAQPVAAQLLLGVSAGGGPTVPLLSINGPVSIAGPTLVQHGGWSATYNGTPPLNIQGSPIPVTVQRPGFDTSGNATTYADTVYIQTNLRVAGPPYVGPPMTADTTNVGLSRTLYASDVVAGVTNNSDEVSPPGVCNWEMPGRRLIGATLKVSVFCAHLDARNNSEVAAVNFTITDGTHSASCLANTMGDDGLFPNDRIHGDFYSCTLNTSALSAGVLLTLNAKVYPWLGRVADGSVWDTSTVTAAQSPSGSVERQFSPRYFIKDAARSGTPVALVCPAGGTYPNGNCTAAGSDATGSWASSLGAAASLPFATITGALNVLTDATKGKPFTAMSGCVNGCADGAVIYLNQGGANSGFSPTTSRAQLVGALEITSDPGGAGKATFTYSAAYRPRLGVGTSLVPTSSEGTVWFENINYNRTANVSVTGEAANNLEMQFTNDVLDTGAADSAALCTNCGVRVYASTVNNYDGGLAEGGTQETRNMRGVLFASIAAANTGLSNWNIVGNEFNGTASHVVNLNVKRAESGSVIYDEVVHFPNPAGDTLAFGDNNSGVAYEIAGLAIVQNIFEINNNTSAVSLGFSRDCDTGTFSGTIKHAVIQYNVVTGTNATGRPNIFYDTCSSPPGLTTPARAHRPHHLIDYRGNAMGVIVFTKQDWFDYNVNGDTTSGQTFIGGWPFMFGSGAQGNLQRFCDSNNGCIGGDRNVFYGGRRSVMGTNGSVDTTANPKWVDDKGVQVGGASGAGYGDYHLQITSPCKGIVDFAALPHGIYGDARPATNDSCGVNP